MFHTILNGALIAALYDQDRRENLNSVWLPAALDKKYPNAGKEWEWFWLFPAKWYRLKALTEDKEIGYFLNIIYHTF